MEGGSGTNPRLSPHSGQVKTVAHGVLTAALERELERNTKNRSFCGEWWVCSEELGGGWSLRWDLECRSPTVKNPLPKETSADWSLCLCRFLSPVGNSLSQGHVLYIVRWLAAALPPQLATHFVQVVTIKNVSRCCQMSPGDNYLCWLHLTYATSHHSFPQIFSPWTITFFSLLRPTCAERQ